MTSTATTTTSSTTSSLAGRAGQLPVIPHEIGQTHALKKALFAFRVMDAERDISCFDGPAGAGKTTACSVAAAQSQRTWRYCILPLRGNARQITATVYEAVFERSARGSERQMHDALLERLCDGDIGIIADEVHHVGLHGAQQLRHLWDHASTVGHPFPLLLVGCGVQEELSQAEEVVGRVARWVNFGQITHVEDATAIASALHPRLAASSDKVINGINSRVVRGSVRAWTQLAKHIDYLPSTGTQAKPKGLNSDDVRMLREILGTDGAAA